MSLEGIPRALIVSGPTASGKSSFALALATELQGEIINADSVQMYREFDIGSAKPTATEMREVPHHLFSELEPNEPFDAYKFSVLARRRIREIAARRAVPIVCGGSGLYIRALLNGLVDIPKDIETEDEESEEQIRSELARLDPAAAIRIPERDIMRARRALAVLRATGRPLSDLWEEQKSSTSSIELSALVFVLLPPREDLYHAINQRTEIMLRDGLEDEVRRIVASYGRKSPALSAIGYRHVVQFLDGQINRDTMIAILKRDTRRYAKRQFTWWHNQPVQLGWTPIERSEEPQKAAREFLDASGVFSEPGVYYTSLLSAPELSKK
jgi:tRNA dimethylallyltransferase